MKKVILTLNLFLIFSFSLLAQIQQPVKWKFEKKEISNNVVELSFKANIEDKWHLYGMNLPEGGPVATKIVFEKITDAQTMGSPVATKKPIEKFDENFSMTVNYYTNNVEFKQKIKLNKKDFKISGYIEYMVCNDQTCLAPTKELFEFISSKESQAVEKKSVDAPTKIVAPVVDTTNNVKIQTIKPTEKKSYWEPVVDYLHPQKDNAKKGFLWWIIFIKGLLGGIIAIFTPCVWPIIPMTVSFFLKRTKNKQKGQRDAILYGASIVVIYLLLGFIITLAFGANALNRLSTSAFFNLLFFILLIIFGASFLGAFEITIPSSWTTKLDQKAENTSGIISIFLMAFTLVLVSFSCTGPIIGTLLVDVSVSGSILAPAIGMFGFALALCIPFTFFAMFPTWLKAMPKSGNWLNSVKVTLGFLELAFALKFLSVADLAYGWRILDREVFIVLWIVIFFMLGLYLLGKLTFAHDSYTKHISFHRLILSMMSFAFSIYMIPGLWGAPLKSISAFLPPLYTQDFNIYKDEVQPAFYDYDKGMEYANKVGKPVIVDFTGYGCVNCRKMEATTWTNPAVKKLMTDKYVLITLFVDDKTNVDTPFEITENGNKQTIKTVGDKWSYLQRHKFGSNAQPYYVLLNNDAKPINEPCFFTEDVTQFTDFLNTGLQNFNKK
jgi:thiol:disulfide interchange protein DsbD